MPYSEERSEICVGRDQHPLLSLCGLEDLFVAGCLKTVIANVRCVVPGFVKSPGYYGGQGVVNQELHPDAANGSSRSRTASAA